MNKFKDEPLVICRNHKYPNGDMEHWIEQLTFDGKDYFSIASRHRGETHSFGKPSDCDERLLDVWSWFNSVIDDEKVVYDEVEYTDYYYELQQYIKDVAEPFGL